MIRFAIPLLAATAIAAPLSAAQVQIQASGPVVELTISEEVKAQPDLATIRTGVTTQARTAVEAMRLNAREMRSVIDRIKALGVDEDDIQTTGVNLNPEYDYNRDTQRQVFKGYRASNNVSIILRDVEETGPVMDALVAAGATDIGGPTFSIDDESTAKAQARRTAMQTARERAMEYAGWAGYSNIRLLEVSEMVGPSRPQPLMRTVAMDASDESTPIQPGMVGSGVTVTVKYEMTN